MGQARQRKLAGDDPSKRIKISPRKLMKPVAFVHHQRVEQTGNDGMVYAVHFYRVVDPETGQAHCEETADGLKPVVLQSVPMAIRRAVLAPKPTLLVSR